MRRMKIKFIAVTRGRITLPKAAGGGAPALPHRGRGNVADGGQGPRGKHNGQTDLKADKRSFKIQQLPEQIEEKRGRRADI